MDLYLYSKIAELGDNETGRGGDYESALDCLICFIRQSHSSQDHEFNHIPLLSGSLILWDFGLPPCPQLSETFRNAHFCWKFKFLYT